MSKAPFASKPAGKATLSVGGKNIELPVSRGTVGPDVIDIRKLYGEGNAFTYDPGFTSTASCEAPTGYVLDATDCDDRVAWATETCNDVDDDCNFLVDDAPGGCPPPG